MGDLVNTGSKYSDEDRLRVVVEYIVSGNVQVVAKRTGIPASTIYDWRKSDWWESLTIKVRSEKEDEFRAQWTQIIEKAHEETLDRLENGDEVHTKDGIKRIKIRGRDAATIGGIAYDKLRLSLNLPTHIKANPKSLEELARQFEKLSSRCREKQGDVIVVQTTEETDE